MPNWIERAGDIVVDINVNDTPTSRLLTDLASLEPIKVSAKPLIKMEKKTEKKKKKKKESNHLGDALTTTYSGVDPESFKVDTNTNYISYLEAFQEELEDDVDDDNEFMGIVSEEKGQRKKSKEAKEVDKQFAANLDLLYELLSDSKGFEKELEKSYKSLTAGKGSGRGISKYSIELAGAVNTARGSTLSIIKEINAVKKFMMDAQMKIDKAAKDSEGPDASNTDIVAAQFMNTIMNNYGRNNLVKNAIDNGVDYDYDDDSSDLANMIDTLKSGRAELQDEMYDRHIEDRLENEPNTFRSEAGSAYIEYEDRDPRVVIIRDANSGDWHFAAVDSEGEPIFGYPLPTPESAGKITFSMDGSYATDKLSRSYKVISTFNDEE